MGGVVEGWWAVAKKQLCPKGWGGLLDWWAVAIEQLCAGEYGWAATIIVIVVVTEPVAGKGNSALGRRMQRT